MSINNFLDYSLFYIGDFNVQVYKIITLILIAGFAKVIIWGVKKFVTRKINEGTDQGRAKATFQLIKYIVIVIASMIALDSLGFKITLLLASSAALFVGIGLGLQNIFNDFVSGILLLFEGTVSLNDIIEVDGVVGKIVEIGIRTSKVNTRDNKIIIVPNSKIISENITNWSFNREDTRFSVALGVAYGSDVQLVKNLLLSAANDHPNIDKTITPTVRFNDFGESSLDFEILFYANMMFEVEFIKSDLRFKIDELFRENNVTIPFPQRDVHLFDKTKSNSKR